MGDHCSLSDSINNLMFFISRCGNFEGGSG